MSKKRKPTKQRKKTSLPAKPPNHRIAVTQQSQTFQYSGILPPAAELERYNEIIPHGAERIMLMAEEQSKHRRDMERIVVTGDSGRANRGQIIAAIVVMSALVAGTYLIVNGFDIQGLVTMLTPLAAVALAFITGTAQRKKERLKKNIKALS